MLFYTLKCGCGDTLKAGCTIRSVQGQNINPLYKRMSFLQRMMIFSWIRSLISGADLLRRSAVRKTVAVEFFNCIIPTMRYCSDGSATSCGTLFCDTWRLSSQSSTIWPCMGSPKILKSLLLCLNLLKMLFRNVSSTTQRYLYALISHQVNFTSAAALIATAIIAYK